MTKYSLRARMMILILAPTLMVGLLLSSFFVVHRYNELQRQVMDAGANIIEPLAISSEYSFELLHLQPRISAIVVANDQMALGVLSALAQLNRSGSQAVSVTGYDDTADSLYFQPPLTTVAQDFDLLGKRAVERLIALMAAPQLRIRELLPTRLIVRQSAWPVAAAEDRQQTLAQLKALVEKL